MNKILVAYATMAGSTVEVVQAVGKEIAHKGPAGDGTGSRLQGT